jgi:hypothetical protein
VAPRAEDGQLEGQAYAYLFDRVAANTGRPQRFGTQGRCTSEAGWQPLPLERPGAVDELRRELGLEPMAEYRARFEGLCP